ncbi:hypothetical protein HMPREF0091_11199 [Fannyhessea vaginae DSM 15829]|uniref:Uncharacterized protein n=1 Tax=Fannyhessea vaginae DSM 15829 TaxID=525256 RepID=F1T6W3_9ACTN|nr:hypothetical protein HMPREF0091_11199 [Fannyhessea vaginae DSM 15829]
MKSFFQIFNRLFKSGYLCICLTLCLFSSCFLSCLCLNGVLIFC